MSDQDDPTIEPDVDTDPADDGTEGGTDDAPETGTAEYWKKRARQHEERARKTKGWADLAREVGKTPDQIRELIAGRTASKDDDAPDPAELRKAAQAEARAEVLVERALDKVEARAAKLFADPEDARALLAGQVDDFIDDGKVDVDAVDEALKELLGKKPHLAAATAKRFQGGADGGARKGSGVSQLTEQDLNRMKPEQIVKAREEGRFNDLLGTS